MYCRLRQLPYHLKAEVVGQAERSAFAEFVDQKDQGVEEMKGQEAQHEQLENMEDPECDSEPDRYW